MDDECWWALVSVYTSVVLLRLLILSLTDSRDNGAIGNVGRYPGLGLFPIPAGQRPASIALSPASQTRPSGGPARLGLFFSGALAIPGAEFSG